MASLVEMRAGRVARLRKEKEEAKKRKEELLKLLENDPIYTELVAINLQLANSNVDLVAAEKALREAAVEQAKLTGETKTPAYTVKNYTVVTYDPKDAVEWCIQHFKEALTVDEDKFEKVVKVMQPDIATVTTEQRASLSSDLSSYVGMPEEVVEDVEVPF